MSEPKPFASLSSGLLARKGALALPCAPRASARLAEISRISAGTTWVSRRPSPLEAPRDEEHDAFGEPIAEHPALHGHAGLTPVNSPVHTQQAEIEDRLQGTGGRDSTRAKTSMRPRRSSIESDELPAQPVEAKAPDVRGAVRFRLRSVRRAPKPRACPGQQGEGCVHSPARSGTSPEAAPGLCPERSLGSASRHRRSRPVPRWNA